MKAKVTILGCGNSTGVPAIGNYWGACDFAEPKNRRSRCSILVQSDETSLVVDTGPDFREQLTRENVQSIDAALYTHAHGDHINGMDELRIISFRRKTRTPIYASSDTLKALQFRFDYLFQGGNHNIYPAVVEPHEITKDLYGKKHKIGDLEFIPFEQDHGTCKATGYRFGDFGYSVDMKRLDKKAIEILKGIKVWLVDAAAYHDADNAVHADIEAIYAMNKQIGAETVYLTSLSLAMDYQTLLKELRPGYKPAFDGLSFNNQ